MLPSRLLTGAVICGVLAGIAGATDQPISGTSLRIQRKPSGKHGWQLSTGNLASYRFRRDRESAGATPVRRAVLRQGRSLKLVLDDAGLALAAPQGAVGIRIRTGALRNCARFAGTAGSPTRPASSSARTRPPPRFLIVRPTRSWVFLQAPRPAATA